MHVWEEILTDCKALQLLKRSQTINWSHTHKKPTEKCLGELGGDFIYNRVESYIGKCLTEGLLLQQYSYSNIKGRGHY